jgi:hypothetical protein
MIGTDSSNSLRSANESVHFAYILEKPESSREMRRSFYPQRTRESHLTPNSSESASILSVRNNNGSLKQPGSVVGSVRPSIASQGDRSKF